MKKSVFVLLALLLVLAALASGQSKAPSDLMPAPSLKAACTSNSQCPKGQLCCIPCGADLDCGRTCLNAVNGHCPLFV
jgi:Cys-rich repeat protein